MESPTSPDLSRRQWLTALWPLGPSAPTAAMIRHEAEDFDTRLIDGALASFVEWPAFALTDHRGRTVELYRDLVVSRSVVLNFFYSQCRGSCPVTMGRMLELHGALAASGKPARFISISLDPEVDTPAALAAHAAAMLPAGADWHFLTGPATTIAKVRRFLGFYDLSPTLDADPRRHAAMVFIGDDRTHRWRTLPAIASLRQWRSAVARCSA